jgi:hypothetical protein
MGLWCIEIRFLCSIAAPFLHPDLWFAVGRRAQPRSRLTPGAARGHRRRRREAV